MSRIEKKIHPVYFDAILSGDKTYELRLADWSCEPGDTLVLNEVDSVSHKPTGRSLERLVGFVGKTRTSTFLRKKRLIATDIKSFH